MKFSSLCALILLVSCASIHRPETPKSELEALLSAEDLKLHQCLQKADSRELRVACLAATRYDEVLSRTPSSDDEELILKNNWFFDSKENLDKFYKVSRAFVRAQERFARKLVNKKAIGVEGSAFVGIGRGWGAEFALHNDKLGFFCAPSWSLQTDVGVEADIAVSRSLSCQSNSDYAGDDVSFGVGISGELIGLPVSIGVAYSFSINPVAFRQKIAEARRSGLLNLSSLRDELQQLNSPELKRALANQYRYALPVLTMALRPLGLLELTGPLLVNRSGLTAFTRDMIRNDRSASSLFKQYYQRQLRQRLLSARLNNLNAFLGALEASLTGCDALSGSASVGVSLLPVSAGVTYAKTHLLAEAGGAELATLSSVTALALLNPFLLPSQDLRNIVKVARAFVTLPQKVQTLCLK